MLQFLSLSQWFPGCSGGQQKSARAPSRDQASRIGGGEVKPRPPGRPMDSRKIKPCHRRGFFVAAVGGDSLPRQECQSNNCLRLAPLPQEVVSL